MSSNAFESFPMVTRIVDYEPPAFGGPPTLPGHVPPRADGTGAAAAGRPRGAPDRFSAAAAFADAALRRVLEVIDRRRPFDPATDAARPRLVDSLLAGGAPRRGSRAGPAAPGVAPSQPAGGTAAEVTANYTRGERVHAVACRIEQVSRPHRWVAGGGAAPGMRVNSAAAQELSAPLPSCRPWPRAAPGGGPADGDGAWRRCAGPRRRRPPTGRRRSAAVVVLPSLWPQAFRHRLGRDGGACGAPSTWTLNRKPTDSSLSASSMPMNMS